MFFGENDKRALAEYAVDQIDKEFGQGTVTTLEDAKKDFVGTIGGIPRGKILEVSSEFAGKTTFSLFMVTHAQMEGGVAAYIDGKHALDPFYAEYLGVDVNNLFVSKPSGFEQTAEVIKQLVLSGGFDVIVVDPNEEQQEKIGEVLGELTGAVEETGLCVVFITRFGDKGDIRSENKVISKSKVKEEKNIDMPAEEPAPIETARPTDEYVFPPKTLLQPHDNPKFVSYVENWDELKEIIEVKMKNFGVDARLIEATKGPTVTRVVIELAENCSVNKLIAATRDLRRLLKVSSDIAVIPQISDTCYSGIEIPNKVRNTVSFQEVFCSRQYTEAEGDILVALGRTAMGDILVEDVARMPHALIAGATGSGKSICMNVIIASILCRYRPDEVKLILIDLKQVEMGIYTGLPHMLFKKPLSDIPQIINALTWLQQETERRFILFKSLHVRNLNEYNKLPGVERLPRIVTLIDEASELMTKQESRKAVERTLSMLARVARAAGIHLLFATQNPVKEVITNEVQNNLNTKIAFAVGDYCHSMLILKAKGAECLLGYGDMYIKRGQNIQRAQCAYISTEETDAIVDYIMNNNKATFDEAEIEKILNGAEETGDEAEEEKTERLPADKEALAWEMLKICYDVNNISCSYLQRRMFKGYNLVSYVLEYWEKEGFISKPNSDKKRKFLKPAEEFYALYKEKFGDKEETKKEREKEEESEEGTECDPASVIEYVDGAWEILKICYETDKVSVSDIQKKVNRGYNHIANIVEYWERVGFISEMDENKKRHLTERGKEYYAIYKDKFGDEKNPIKGEKKSKKKK